MCMLEVNVSPRRSYDRRRALESDTSQKSSSALGRRDTDSDGAEMERILRLLGNRSRPEIPWISRVMGCSGDQARNAASGMTGEMKLIAELSENIRRTGRSYYAQFPAPVDLYALVRLSRPLRLVESGVASGVSSSSILLGIKANARGALHSIDFPVPRTKNDRNESWAIPGGMTSGWAVPARLRKGWDLREGRSEELLGPLLQEISILDFYWHDCPVDVAHFAFEMKAIRKHLRPGSVVVADNTDKATFDEAAESVGARAHYRRGSSLGAFRVPQ